MERIAGTTLFIRLVMFRSEVIPFKKFHNGRSRGMRFNMHMQECIE